MSDILFSVVIPCYNYAYWVERAITSVALQLGSNAELIVVNDGSTDDSLAVIRRCLAQVAPAAHVIDKTNGGLSSARNAGIDASRGRYLLFLDADDELLAGALLAAEQDIQTHGDTGLLIGGKESMRRSGVSKICLPAALPPTPELRFAAFLLKKHFFIANGCVFMHRDIFKRFRYNESLLQVEDLPIFAYALFFWPARTLNRPLARIYHHADSLRHNLRWAEQTGMSIVDIVFDPSVLPPLLMRYKNRYTVQRSLSLFRTYYQAGESREALRIYGRLLRQSPLVLFKLSYTRKALRAVNWSI
jgi:glycosyltransferase involved in cell wall biosynthesis